MKFTQFNQNRFAESHSCSKCSPQLLGLYNEKIKVASYSFSSARPLISKISRWRKLLNSTPKSHAGSRSKMPTNMVSKLLKFAYRKCCVDRLRFQNICRLNRKPQLSLLDVKEKYRRHAGVSTNEADFVWFVRSPRSSSGAKQDSILLHIFRVLGVVCVADTKAKIWVRMWLPYKLRHLTSSRGARSDASKIENNKTQQPENTANNN